MKYSMLASLLCVVLLAPHTAWGAVEITSQQSTYYAEVQIDQQTMRQEGPSFVSAMLTTPDLYVRAAAGRFQVMHYLPTNHSGGFVGEWNYALQNYLTIFTFPPVPKATTVVSRAGHDTRVDFRVSDVSVLARVNRSGATMHLTNLSDDTVVMSPATPWGTKVELTPGSYQMHLQDSDQLAGWGYAHDTYGEPIFELEYTPTPEPYSIVIWIVLITAIVVWKTAYRRPRPAVQRIV